MGTKKDFNYILLTRCGEIKCHSICLCTENKQWELVYKLRVMLLSGVRKLEVKGMIFKKVENLLVKMFMQSVMAQSYIDV